MWKWRKREFVDIIRQERERLLQSRRIPPASVMKLSSTSLQRSFSAESIAAPSTPSTPTSAHGYSHRSICVTNSFIPPYRSVSIPYLQQFERKLLVLTATQIVVVVHDRIKIPSRSIVLQAWVLSVVSSVSNFKEGIFSKCWNFV